MTLERRPIPSTRVIGKYLFKTFTLSSCPTRNEFYRCYARDKRKGSYCRPRTLLPRFMILLCLVSILAPSGILMGQRDDYQHAGRDFHRGL